MEALPGYPWVSQEHGFEEHRLAYLDEGEGDPVLLLHGEPTWSYLYRKVLPPVAEVARVVAPDYLGFGRSDKPTDPGWYSYDRHAASIRSLVEALDLRRLTIVVQDWGGPIGMRIAAEVPDRVDRLVVLNTAIGAGRMPEVWLRFRELMRHVGTDIQPSRLVEISCARAIAEDVLAAYDAPYPDAASKAGVVAFPEHVPTEPDHPNAPALMRVRDAMAQWEKPALVLFGDSDPIFPPAAAERMAELIPGAGPAELVADAGHMVQEDAGEEVGERIARFLRETSATGVRS
jgi:haloalkane dehalogenase